MKVLFVTFIRPSSKFGGGISTLQSLKAISDCARLDYIGIDFDTSEFESYGIKIGKRYIIEPEISKIKIFINWIFTGISSSYYKNWEKMANNTIDLSKYDCIYLDYTRHAFVAEWANKKGIPLIVRSHNVEVDYFESLYKKKKNIKNYLHIKTGKMNERECLNFANRILVLTRSEEDRYIDLYRLERNKFQIYPQCVKHFNDIPYVTGKPYILITGSLWFGPNAEGTEWFLDNVWSEISTSAENHFKLIIAGANPNESLVTKTKEYKDVELIANPDEIGAFYKGASLYVAPIFYGAGMKVKIAEALACGLKVIATTHALEGYENARDYMIEANAKNEFINAILNEIKGNIWKDKEKILDIFKKNYSLEASTQIIAQVLKEEIGVNG